MQCTKPSGSSHFIGWLDKPRQDLDALMKDMPMSQLTLQHLLQLPLTPRSAGRRPSTMTPLTGQLLSPAKSTPSRSPHNQQARIAEIRTHTSESPGRATLSTPTDSIDDIYEPESENYHNDAVATSTGANFLSTSSQTWGISTSEAAAILTSAAMAAPSANINDSLDNGSEITPFSATAVSSSSGPAAVPSANTVTVPLPTSSDGARNHVNILEW